MNAESEYFIGACTHVDATPEILNRNEIDASAQRQSVWLRDMLKKGSRLKVAVSYSKSYAQLIRNRSSRFVESLIEIQSIICPTIKTRIERAKA